MRIGGPSKSSGVRLVAPGLEERFQGGGSIGDFVGVNHPVVVGVQREEDRRQRAAAGRPALAARRRSAIAPLHAGTGPLSC